MTAIYEDRRMGRFGTANIEGTVRLPLVAKNITRREVNICNPFEYEAYHLQEGYTRNVVLTSDNFVVEITPKEIKRYTVIMGYVEERRPDLDQNGGSYFNYVLNLLEGLTHDALRKSNMIVIEKNVPSPFINHAHESAKV